MKHIAKKLVMATIAGVAFNSAIAAEDFCPYVGVDFKQTWMSPHKELKDEMPKSYSGANLFIGGKFNENIGLELGYDFSPKKKKNYTEINNSELDFAGNVVPAHVNMQSKTRVQNVHLDVVGYLPLENDFEFLVSAGLGLFNIKGSDHYRDTGALYDSAKSKQTPIARVGLGVQGMVQENIGVRAMARWENTSRVKVKGTSFKPLKDSFSANFGVFYQF
ncbi:MAG: hypothetical protein JWM09_857 [Francisellaceae bacterium]|nr:hypothetical protein [Francisellaceae bacterium]